ncbi:MAG: ATP-binding protein [Chloroflexi bacterium]|nr:ATP-binding protein [Chloroflexota bacterium]
MAIDARAQAPFTGTFGDDGRTTELSAPRPKTEGEFDYHYHLDKSRDLRGSRLPLPRNPAFVGHDDTLAQLAARLNTDNALAILVGPHGIGKTQTAIEFAHRFASQFPGGIFWLRCAHRDLIPGEVAACGSEDRASVPNYDSLPQAEKISIVVSAWHKPIPRLLILDDVDDPATVHDWQPETGGCRVLILTHHEDWAGQFGSQVLTLPPLDTASGLHLLAGSDPARLQTFSADLAANAIVDLLIVCHWLCAAQAHIWPATTFRPPTILHAGTNCAFENS